MSYCSNVAGKCAKIQSGPTIVVRDPQSIGKLVITRRSQQRVCVHRVDGDLIPKGTVACDFLITICGQIELFVELKGCAVIHGITQLEASIRRLRNVAVSNRYAYLVSNRFPPMIRTDVQRAKIRFLRDYGTVLVIKNRLAEITL